MPVSKYVSSPEMIELLSNEISLFHQEIGKMKKTNDVIDGAMELIKKYNIDCKDESQRLRYIMHFISIQKYEINSVLKEMLLSTNEVDDIRFIKYGIVSLQEGCKRLIGFHIAKKNGSVCDKMISDSMLYQITTDLRNDHSSLFLQIEEHINNFRNKLETNHIKDIRCELIHYQNIKGDFNPFNFTNTAFSLNCNDIYHLLMDYTIFLKLITHIVNSLMKMGYR